MNIKLRSTKSQNRLNQLSDGHCERSSQKNTLCLHQHRFLFQGCRAVVCRASKWLAAALMNTIQYWILKRSASTVVVLTCMCILQSYKFPGAVVRNHINLSISGYSLESYNLYFKMEHFPSTSPNMGSDTLFSQRPKRWTTDITAGQRDQFDQYSILMISNSRHAAWRGKHDSSFLQWFRFVCRFPVGTLSVVLNEVCDGMGGFSDL